MVVWKYHDVLLKRDIERRLKAREETREEIQERKYEVRKRESIVEDAA